MKRKAAVLSSAKAEELSRLLTVERLKHAGVMKNLAKITHDPDLKPLVEAVHKVSKRKARAKPSPFTNSDLKKLAGL